MLEGLVIPACPLPLDSKRNWSRPHQRALTRYYVASGAGGIAVGVHSTQFAIRSPKVGLLEPVLQLVSEELDALKADSVVRIAGICGPTDQAIRETELALRLGYHAGMVSMTAFRDEDESVVLKHCRKISTLIPVVGFYLQTAVGGRVFTQAFWRKFAEIPNLVAIKIAPFNRYQTGDVVRAVIEAGREDVALYTGNDDNIIVDLLTPFEYLAGEKRVRRFITGGLLGQWGVWTSCAVRMMEKIRKARQSDRPGINWLTENAALTDANAALFDSANGFAGCIPGIMEVLRRVGLAPSNCCLDPNEQLSPNQSTELDRVIAAYPQLTDDEFVRANLDQWLK